MSDRVKLSKAVVVGLLLVCMSLTTLMHEAGVSHAQASSSGILVALAPNHPVGTNNMSLGFMLDYEWKYYLSIPALREKPRDINPKLIRVFDWKTDEPRASPHPCTYWNETTGTGSFDWSDVDSLVQSILITNSEPLFALGAYGWPTDGPQIPPGMAVNPDTNLPYPQSFAAYASEWVKHFKAVGLPVRFYEIVNEPWTYFGWERVDLGRLANYMQLFNAAATSMRRENPNVLVSFDFITRKPVLDYWLTNGGADVDYLSFHKYDSGAGSQKTDQEILMAAEQQYYDVLPMGYSLAEAKRVWFNARGKLLPTMNSESNLDSAWIGGSDPRIQQMIGAVWLALSLRTGVLQDLTYNVYYTLYSSASLAKKRGEVGVGFGMINSDDLRPWYPYYVHYMLGRSLGVGDPLIDVTSSSEDVRPLAWLHNGELKILLICKVDQPRTVYLQGLTGQASLMKIDNTIPWTAPSVQKAVVDANAPLIVNGYTVALLTINPSAMNPLDFSLSSSGGIAATQGSPGSGTINATLLNGATQPVALACAAGLPPSASCSFSPQSGSPSFTSTVTISTSPSTPAGSFNVTLSGTSGGISRTTSLILTVNPQTTTTAAKITSVTVNPNPVKVGKTTTFTVTVENTSTVALQNAMITISLYRPDGKLATTLNVKTSGLASGASSSYKTSWQVSSTTLRGTYTYSIAVNSGTVLLDTRTGTVVVK
jgi:hypothetical protein